MSGPALVAATGQRKTRHKPGRRSDEGAIFDIQPSTVFFNFTEEVTMWGITHQLFYRTGAFPLAGFSPPLHLLSRQQKGSQRFGDKQINRFACGPRRFRAHIS